MTAEQIRNSLKIYNLRAVADKLDYSYYKIWRFVANRNDDEEVKKLLEEFLNDQR